MIEAFNRILRAFGANRIQLTEVNNGYIQFKLGILGCFLLVTRDQCEAEVLEWNQDSEEYQPTKRSKWLQAIGEGKT
jgi:hypothetical protein